MLIIEFVLKNKIVRWELSNRAVFIITYILGTLILEFIIRARKNYKAKKSISEIRGGSEENYSARDLIKCVNEDKDSVYLVTAEKIFNAAKKLLKLKDKNTNIIVVSRVVLLLAILEANSVANLISVSGFTIMIDKARSLGLNFLSALLTILGVNLVLPIVVSQIISVLNLTIPSWVVLYLAKWQLILKTLAVPTIIAFYGKITDCDNFVSKLPQAYTIIKKTPIYFIDEPKSHQKMLIVTPEPDQKIYLKVPEEEKTCDVMPIENEGKPVIFVDTLGEDHIYTEPAEYKEVCKQSSSKFIPLKQRTKTLADIKTGDTTERLETIEKIANLEIDKKELALRLKN